ncbi:DUF4365 domain-containing protein [Thalassotalea castellviae]|uniref:DUF4365 domain-containing protein n=1 Tax=Thalassotalea castellviae TaxID=3075612 RepID=A0ABU3A667_9GAMM|nr:DUF4365 domain-containing protein [Thalassotalea sp. W431]MDT0605042.1 DUF4365 domain-containing protein [Thalassotalea sp. W431]
MPIRPQQHQLEDLSRDAFSSLLPREWVVRDKNKDYGIDVEVEIFDHRGYSTGLVFWVQLKATESTKESDRKKVSLEIETVDYYKSLDLPVLIARYSLEGNSFYVKWAHEVDFYPRKKGQKTKTINCSDELSKENALQLKGYLEKIKNIKQRKFNFPISISFEIQSEMVNKIDKWSLESQLKKELKKYSSLFVYEKSKSKSLIQIIISSKDLFVSFSGLTGCVIHKLDKIENDFVYELINSASLGISIALTRVGASELAAKIVLHSDIKEYFFSYEKLILELLPHILCTQYFDELIDAVLENMEYQDTNLIEIITHGIGMMRDNSGRSQFDSIESLLKKTLVKYKNKNWENLLGIAHYNLANHYRSRSRFNESLHHFIRAKRCDPSYLNRDYYHRECAGVLFELGKFLLSSKLYENAIKLGNENSDKALYADALMHSGLYKQANTHLIDYLDNTDSPDSIWQLKHVFLDSLIENSNVTEQRRQPKQAKDIINFELNGKERLANLEAALDLDNLYGLAWYNLGWHFYCDNNIEASQLCYLSCAVLQTWDIEAWVNAISLGFNKKTPICYLPLMIQAAYSYKNEEFLAELYKKFQDYPINERKVFYELISEVIRDINEPVDQKEFRMIDNNQVVDIMKITN